MTHALADFMKPFFSHYLPTQRGLSTNTIASYRDAMLLFLDFAHEHLGKAPSALRLVDISPDQPFQGVKIQH